MVSLRALLQRRHSSKDSGQEPQGELRYLPGRNAMRKWALYSSKNSSDDVSCYCHIHDNERKCKLGGLWLSEANHGFVLLAVRLLFLKPLECGFDINDASMMLRNTHMTLALRVAKRQDQIDKIPVPDSKMGLHLGTSCCSEKLRLGTVLPHLVTYLQEPTWAVTQLGQFETAIATKGGDVLFRPWF